MLIAPQKKTFLTLKFEHNKIRASVKTIVAGAYTVQIGSSDGLQLTEIEK